MKLEFCIETKRTSTDEIVFSFSIDGPLHPPSPPTHRTTTSTLLHPPSWPYIYPNPTPTPHIAPASLPYVLPPPHPTAVRFPSLMEAGLDSVAVAKFSSDLATQFPGVMIPSSMIAIMRTTRIISVFISAQMKNLAGGDKCLPCLNAVPEEAATPRLTGAGLDTGEEFQTPGV